MTASRNPDRYIVRRFFDDGDDNASFSVMEYVDDIEMWVDRATCAEPWTAMDLCDKLNGVDQHADEVARLENALCEAYALISRIESSDRPDQPGDWQHDAKRWRDETFPNALAESSND